MSILTEIIAHKQTEIGTLDARSLRHAAENSPAPRDFRSALSPLPVGEGCPKDRVRVRLIAELKRASPSKGILAPHLDLFQVAEIYVQNGASAISVLTDEKFFMGRLETLGQLRFVRQVQVPLLRKDFIVDAVQLYESRAYGADAILLIAAALPDDKHFADLHALALELGLTPLVEVHNEAETARALKLKDIHIIGINNRNLATFDLSLETTARIRPMIPAEISVVAESGIFTKNDVQRLAKANVDAILVGEALVTSEDIAAKVRELAGFSVIVSPSGAGGEAISRTVTGIASSGTAPSSQHLHSLAPTRQARCASGASVTGQVNMTKIKICGIKTVNDALAAMDAGADLIGFNFYSKSPRCIDVGKCRDIMSVMRKYGQITYVGVFVNASAEEVRATMDTCGLNLAQLHGNESSEMLRSLNGRAFKAFRGIPVSLNSFARDEAPAFLLDASVKGSYGGTGSMADWDGAAELAKHYPILLAGGLTPQNVADAVKQVRPWGVDVASGVESTPGRKDPARMKAFVQAVKGLASEK
jgi:indole-3-glycerol phosphate synthase / phosphoribosylanthranilate isomerase